MSIKLPSIFTYQKSIVPSLAIFKTINNDKTEEYIGKQLNRLCSTFSDYKTSKTGVKNSCDLALGNLQSQESAYVSSNAEFLKISFSFKVLNNARKPYSSNDIEVRQKFIEFVDTYKSAGGIEFISKEYIKAIFRGDFLWRNKNIMEDIQIKVMVDNHEFVLPIKSFDAQQKENNLEKEIIELSKIFEKALIESVESKVFYITAIGKIAPNTEVYPSQIFNDLKTKNTGRELSTTRIGKDNVVVFTPEKIGNALRRIDIWYDENVEYPLPVEPLGVDRNMGIAHRHKNKNSFYSLVEGDFENILKSLKEGKTTPESHFIFACLVRGNVYNGKGAEKKK